MEQVKINEKALLARIDRTLRKEGKKLYKSRTEMVREEFGEYFLTSGYDSDIERKGLRLEEYAREMGFLKPYEVLV